MLALRDGLEYDTRVVLVVEREFGAIQEPAVALVKRVGEIPVVQRDEGLDPSVEEVIDEAPIEVKPLLVDGVLASAERDDARPGEREAVRRRADGLEERDVLARTVVRIAGYGATAAVGNLARDRAERVPDRGPAAVLVDGAFDLVAAQLSVRKDTSSERADSRGLGLILTTLWRNPT